INKRLNDAFNIRCSTTCCCVKCIPNINDILNIPFQYITDFTNIKKRNDITYDFINKWIEYDTRQCDGNDYDFVSYNNFAIEFEKVKRQAIIEWGAASTIIKHWKLIRFNPDYFAGKKFMFRAYYDEDPEMLDKIDKLSYRDGFNSIPEL